LGLYTSQFGALMADVDGNDILREGSAGGIRTEDADS
jgi:hypothetical protein